MEEHVIDVIDRKILIVIDLMGNPYYGGFLFLIEKLQKLSRWNSLLSLSGPIHASCPNFRPIGSELSENIEHKKNK